MLSQWLKWAPPNHPSPTLEDVVVALQNIGHESLAVNLKPMFLQRKGWFVCTQLETSNFINIVDQLPKCMLAVRVMKPCVLQRKGCVHMAFAEMHYISITQTSVIK